MSSPHPFEIRNPRFSIRKVKGLLFDLDETLYFIPSGRQFKRYGENLAVFLPPEKKSSYLKALEEAWSGKSPFQVGRSLDPNTRWILDFDDSWKLSRVYSLEGKEIAGKEWQKIYPKGTHEKEIPDLIHIASGWGIPSALGRLRGLGREHYRKAYLATRSEMMKNPEDFPMVHPGELQTFFGFLAKKVYPLAVATNSDSEDAHHILERLQIKEYFHRIESQAKKPVNSKILLQKIARAFGIDYPGLLVIGDSVYNDLREAKLLGAQTVLIERFPGQPLGTVDVRVWNLAGLMELWTRPRQTD